jgi:hypothetical protein
MGHTVVLGPTHSPVVEGRIYGSIQTLQKMHGDTYLFAVNIAADTVVVRFESVPARLERVEVLFEGREIPVSGSAFEDSFAELDVHVYRMVSHRSVLPLVADASP